jgi:hypothetical protein
MSRTIRCATSIAAFGGRLLVTGEPRLSGAASGRCAAATAPPWNGIRAGEDAPLIAPSTL